MDLLFSRSEEWIKNHLYQNFSGRFCRLEIDEEPEQAGEGEKVLFSDGEQIRAESYIEEVRKDCLRLEPLTAVQKPNPEDPPGTGYVYVDAEDCGKYCIEFMGMEYVYETLHDLIEAILEKKPVARIDEDVLCHIIWTEVEDLNLNDRSDFLDRFERGDIVRVRNELQVKRGVFPPMEPDEVRSRYSGSAKANRIYESLENYVEQVKEFYAEQGRDAVVERMDQAFSFEKNRVEERKKAVREAAAGRDLDAEFAGDASA
jgi:hypothetical protein